MLLKTIEIFTSILLVTLLLTSELGRVFLLAPIVIVMFLDYFSYRDKKRDFIEYLLLLILLSIINLGLWITIFSSLYVIPINAIINFVTSILIFLFLCLVVFQKRFILRVFYWFSRLLYNKINKGDFGRAIPNTYLLGLFLASLVIAYSNNLYNYVEQYILNEYVAFFILNGITLFLDCIVYVIWKELFFKKQY